MNSTAQTTEWLTLAQCSEIAQVHDATLRREMRRGALRVAKIGGRKLIRVKRAWLDEWLEASSTPSK